MIKYVVAAICLFFVAGCSSHGNRAPTETLSASFYPAYSKLDGGPIVSTKCLSGHIATFRLRPSGCNVDRATAAHVADKRDLLRPRVPGPTRASVLYRRSKTPAAPEATSEQPPSGDG